MSTLFILQSLFFTIVKYRAQGNENSPFSYCFNPYTTQQELTLTTIHSLHSGRPRLCACVQGPYCHCIHTPGPKYTTKVLSEIHLHSFWKGASNTLFPPWSRVQAQFLAPELAVRQKNLPEYFCLDRLYLCRFGLRFFLHSLLSSHSTWIWNGFYVIAHPRKHEAATRDWFFSNFLYCLH